MTPQTTTPSGPAVSEGSTVSAASLAKIRALSASSDAVSGASSGGQGGKSISRLAVALIIGGVLLVLLCALSFAVGSRMFPLDRSIDGFLHPEANTIESKLIWAKRAPRTAAALLVGAALAVSGVLMQALSRNPLAEPGLLGVNSGAAASVVVGVGVFGVSSPFVQLWLALLGSGLAAALVFVMGLVDSKPNLDSTARLVLTGVAVNACLGTITGIITMFNSKAFDSHRFWVVGSLENRTFEQVLSALPFVALGLVLSFMLIGPLRALALGEDAAAGLGVPVTWCVARRLLRLWRCAVQRLRLRARLVLWVWSCRMWCVCWWVPILRACCRCRWCTARCWYLPPIFWVAFWSCPVSLRWVL